MQNKFTRVLRDTLILGTGIMKMRWDTEKINGLGNVTADIVDPFSFFPDPDATCPEEMEWCIQKIKMSKRQIKKLYKKDVPSDSEFKSDDHTRDTDTKQGMGKMSNMCTVLEYWYYDEDGRVRVRVTSNGIFLEDRESPYEINEFPFIFFHDHQLTGEFWSMGEIEQLETLQKELNKLRAMVLDNAIAQNNSMIVVDTTAGVDVTKLKNEPGLIVEKNPGGNIVRLPAPSIPPYIQAQIDITKRAMEEVSGIHDVSKGEVAAQTAASAIQILTENSQTRLRAKLRNVESAVKKIAEWYLVMFRQFMQEPRIVRLTGDDQSFKFVTFEALNLRPEVPVVSPETGEHELHPETGEPMTETRLTEFDILISSGSSMMLNKSAKYQQTLELYNAGAADVETLLMAADIGNPKEILERLIKYGRINDPNAPKVDVSQVLGDLGIKVHANINSPDVVKTLLDNMQQQVDQSNAGSIEQAQIQNNALEQANKQAIESQILPEPMQGE